MLIVSLRTDKPVSEIGLYDDETRIAYETWHAHRQLAETLHASIAKLLQSHNKDWKDIEGIVVYKGPGSYTGLRIGMSVANALAGTQNLPIVATTGEHWLSDGIAALLGGKSDVIALPEYGADAFTTPPKK